MSNLIPFDFNSNSVRVINTDAGKILFIAKDVAEALGYEKPSNAISQHCKHAKSLKQLGYPVLGGGSIDGGIWHNERYRYS